MDVGIVILAAGSSSRMNQSKQLLEVKGEPLLLKSVRIALQSQAKKVVVVLGANETAHRKLIDRLSVEIVSNPEWQKGMGSSLKKGLHDILQIFPLMQSVIVMVCDQPLLTTAYLNQLIENSKSTKDSIVASYYSNTVGVPALFKKKLFDQLLSIADREGAKSILQENKNAITTIEFPGGETDLDTRSDYEKFISTNLF
jgi:molybdenum cofactor cytidylyltransferase